MQIQKQKKTPKQKWSTSDVIATIQQIMGDFWESALLICSTVNM